MQGNPKGVILSHAAVNANASTADIVYNVRHLNRGRKSQQTNLPFRLSPFSVFEQCDWTQFWLRNINMFDRAREHVCHFCMLPICQ